jgi:hypothetical protein
MRERAERIGARMKVWSRAAAGTEVELSVPSHVAFQSSSHARRGLVRSLLRKTEAAAQIPLTEKDQ